VRACGNLASVLVIAGDIRRSAELHKEALGLAREIGYIEATRWLGTEVAIDEALAGDWAEATRIVDEMIPTFAESPFWIEPQTRVVRARILIAQGAIADAVADADVAVELGHDGRIFQALCDPLAFRARLHAELGEPDAARRVMLELMDQWEESGSAYVDHWVIDAWFAAWRTETEEQLQQGIEARPKTPWLEAASALIRRDFDTATSRLEEMGAVSAAALAHMWGAEWLEEQGRDPRVHLERALSFWHSVGAAGYIRRSESLAA
jgi:hypothetical protein